MINLDFIKKNRILYKIFLAFQEACMIFIGFRILKESSRMVSESTPRPDKDIEEPPETIENFEDLYFLFFSNFMNRKLAQVDLNEAAYIFRTIRKEKPMGLVEIGTYKGGTALLMSVAKPKEAKFVSLDIKAYSHPIIKKSLKEHSLLLLQNSKEFIPDFKIDFLFIDGDHTYKGVKEDFEHFFPYLNKGADILLHDAVRAGRYLFTLPQINKFTKELELNPKLKLAKDIQTIRHFKVI